MSVMTNTKKEKHLRVPRTRAMDLRIGQSFEASDEGETIKSLAELCLARPTPHVHVTTTEDAYCFGFRQVV